jgi:hypothetical protein
MSDHARGHPEGQANCDELLGALAELLPGIERKPAKAMCAFHLPRGPNFAYVYHFKTKRRLDVWFPSLATEHFHPVGTAVPVIRETLGTSWADNWAWHFEIESPSQATDGAAFLAPLGKQKRRMGSRKSIRPIIPEELPGTTDPDHVEGAAAQVLVNRFERDPKARARCIKIHGTRCIACGFTFRAAYGSQFEGLIVVHHLIPIASIGKEYRVDPAKDLVPLCANCHLLVHQRVPPYTVEEVRALLRPGSGPDGV